MYQQTSLLSPTLLRSPFILVGVISVLLTLCLMTTVLAMPKVKALGLFPERALLDVDGERKFLRVGESYKGVKLIDAYSEQAVIEVAGQQHTLKLGSDIGGRMKGPAEQPEVTLYADTNGMFVANGTINNYPVDFLVDTGANVVALSGYEADRIGLSYRDAPRGMATTASGTVPTYRVKLPVVKVGDIQVYNVNAIVLEGGYPTRPLLGQSFLHNVEMQRDAHKLILKQKW